MWGSLKASAACLASALSFVSLLFVWAAPPSRGAAHFRAGRGARADASFLDPADFLDSFGKSRLRVAASFGESKPRVAATQGARLPSLVSLRESGGRGLLVETWVNGEGPFTFALDTGAGATILSPRVAGAARVEVEAGGRGIEVGGLSGMTAGGGEKAFPRSIALGSRENTLPARGLAMVAPGLPADIDGILDPTEAFSPLGYIIDIPHGELRGFDPRVRPLHAGDAPPAGAVVAWLTDGRSSRPFVMLEGGRRALLDTGSGFGLAVDEAAARSLGILSSSGRERVGTRDIAGGEISSRRVGAATVSVGPLVLRGVPTDFLTHAEKGAPILLGRDALRPFRLTFDPLSRLVMFEPVEN